MAATGSGFRWGANRDVRCLQGLPSAWFERKNVERKEFKNDKTQKKMIRKRQKENTTCDNGKDGSCAHKMAREPSKMASEPHQDAHSATQWFIRLVFGFGFGLTSPKPRRRFPGLGSWFFWVLLVGLPLTTAGADGLSLAPWSAVQTGPLGPPSVRRGANAMMASVEQRLFAAGGAALAAEACEDTSCEPVVAASFGADSCLGLHSLHVSWSPGIWIFLAFQLFLEEHTLLGRLFQCLAVHRVFLSLV